MDLRIHEHTNYRNLTNNTKGPFQYAFKADLSLWSYFNERPEQLSVFNTIMEGQRAGRSSWFEFYPVKNLLCNRLKAKNAVLIVDVGGGRGHDLEALRGAFPAQHGRMVVQDVPETIDEITHLTPGVESMKFDIFTPQPIKDLWTFIYQ